MSRRSTLLLVFACSLPGCAATASRAELSAAESQAQSARADARREHAQLIELEARLRELEHRLASRARACEGTPDPLSVDVARAREQPQADPLRSQGDFAAEARAVAPASKVALGASPEAASPAAERERMERLLEELRAYDVAPQSGLSLERREALRVLLRHERQLDLMNPWGDR